jgi:hypothetical protein
MSGHRPPRRHHDRSPRLAIATEPVKCYRCPTSIARADQCSCNLCPACCDRYCRVRWDDQRGAYTSRCGNCA